MCSEFSHIYIIKGLLYHNYAILTFTNSRLITLFGRHLLDASYLNLPVSPHHPQGVSFVTNFVHSSLKIPRNLCVAKPLHRLIGNARLGIYETQNNTVWTKCTIYYVKAGGSPFTSLAQGFRTLEFIRKETVYYKFGSDK